jgi:hypothetical protein
MQDTPEQRAYYMLVIQQLNDTTGQLNCIGRLLNDLSYEDGVYIMKRLAARFNYECSKIVVDYTDDLGDNDA